MGLAGVGSSRRTSCAPQIPGLGAAGLWGPPSLTPSVRCFILNMQTRIAFEGRSLLFTLRLLECLELVQSGRRVVSTFR